MRYGEEAGGKCSAKFIYQCRSNKLNDFEKILFEIFESYPNSSSVHRNDLLNTKNKVPSEATTEVSPRNSGYLH